MISMRLDSTNQFPAVEIRHTCTFPIASVNAAYTKESDPDKVFATFSDRRLPSNLSLYRSPASMAAPPTPSKLLTSSLNPNPIRLAFLRRPLPRRLSTASPFVILAVSGSSGTKPTVLVAEKLGEAGLQLLREFANVDCAYGLSHEELCGKVSLCDALVVRSGTQVGRDVFESSKGRLKVVGRAGVGIDNVDLAAATEYGCLVVNAPTANTVAAAEHGVALLASMARNVAQADASIKSGVVFLVDQSKSSMFSICFII